jgi:transglutaminase-like putative cysteine protease
MGSAERHGEGGIGPGAAGVGLPPVAAGSETAPAGIAAGAKAAGAKTTGARAAGRLQALALVPLALGLPALQPGFVLSWLALALVLLAGLKLREAHRIEERRLVALMQLVCAGLLAALQPDLAPSLLQLLAVVLALAGLLALESGAAPSWTLLLRRSLQVIAAALPMALALFLLVPRLAPFGPVAGLGRGLVVSGLSASLEPGSIAALVSSDAAAARVSFARSGPPPAGQRYWRVLVHDRFDGLQWTSSTEERLEAVLARQRGGTDLGGALSAMAPERAAADAIPLAGRGDGAAGPGAAPAAWELWLSEPSALRAVPWSGDGRPLGPELHRDRDGVLRHGGSEAQRRLYGIAVAPGVGSTVPDWRRQPPGPYDQELPRGANPRLEALAKDWARRGPAPRRLAAAEAWFRSQPFRYSQSPGTLPGLAPLDVFLFERRQGFCGHYASAFTTLMRAAGVPARVVSGYRGGTWVEPLGGPPYLDLRQSDAHAWSEVWLEGEGWRRVDPTAWVAEADATGSGQQRGPATWLVRQWWGLDLAWGRWWLGFDRGSQQALLARLLGEQRELVGLVVLGALALGLAGGLGGLRWLGGLAALAPASGGAPRRELERSLALLARHGLEPRPGETLPRFSERLAEADPALAAAVAGLVGPYQRWRYGPGPAAPTGAAPGCERGAEPRAMRVAQRRAERRLLAELRRQRRRLRTVLGRRRSQRAGAQGASG